MYNYYIWGYSSAGRALAWHARGQRFDPLSPPFTRSPSSRGLGHRPFTAVTGVRIPLGTPLFIVRGFFMRNFIIYFSLVFLVSCFGTKRHNQYLLMVLPSTDTSILQLPLLILMAMEFKMVMNHLVQRMQMVIMQSHQILIFQVLEL